MIITGYFLRRFLLATSTINIIITALFVCIEFFEKMMRTHDVSVGAILYFLLLDSLPAFFNYLPVSTWLASCFIIRDMNIKNEWEALAIMGIRKKTIARIILSISCILFVCSLIGKEFISAPLNVKVQSYKQAIFKHQNANVVYNKWFLIDQTTLFSFQRLDTQSMMADSVLLVQLSESFAPEKIISAPQAHLDSINKSIKLKNPSILDTQTTEMKEIEQTTIKHPELFAQLTLTGTQPTLATLAMYLFAAHHDGASLYTRVFADLFERLLWHLQILIYPLLSFLIFCLMTLEERKRWLLIIALYPFVVITTSATSFFVHQGLSPLLLSLPYCLLLVITGSLFAKTNS